MYITFFHFAHSFFGERNSHFLDNFTKPGVIHGSLIKDLCGITIHLVGARSSNILLIYLLKQVIAIVHHGEHLPMILNAVFSLLALLFVPNQ